jgi:hypothetical protein
MNLFPKVPQALEETSSVKIKVHTILWNSDQPTHSKQRTCSRSPERSPSHQRIVADMPRRNHEQKILLSPLAALVSNMKDKHARNEDMKRAEIRGISSLLPQTAPAPAGAAASTPPPHDPLNVNGLYRAHSFTCAMPPIITQTPAPRCSPIQGCVSSQIVGKSVGRARAVSKEDDKYAEALTECGKCSVWTSWKLKLPCGRTVTLCPQCSSAFLDLCQQRLPKMGIFPTQHQRRPSVGVSATQQQLPLHSIPQAVSRGASFSPDRSRTPVPLAALQPSGGRASAQPPPFDDECALDQPLYGRRASHYNSNSSRLRA